MKKKTVILVSFLDNGRLIKDVEYNSLTGTVLTTNGQNTCELQKLKTESENISLGQNSNLTFGPET